MIDFGIQAVWPETWGWLIEFRDGKIWEKTNGSSTWHSSSSGSGSGEPWDDRPGGWLTWQWWPTRPGSATGSD